MLPDDKALEILKDMDKNLDWFGHNYEQLRKFGGKFVAISKRKILCISNDFSGLLEEIKKQGEEPTDILIQYIPELDLDIIYNCQIVK